MIVLLHTEKMSGDLLIKYFLVDGLVVVAKMPGPQILVISRP
jgi:hypothetical protein